MKTFPLFTLLLLVLTVTNSAAAGKRMGLVISEDILASADTLH